MSYHYVIDAKNKVIVSSDQAEYDSLPSEHYTLTAASNGGFYISAPQRPSACHNWDTNATAWVLDVDLVADEVSRLDDRLITLQVRRDTANTLGLTSKVTELDAKIVAVNQEKTDVQALT